MRSEENRVTLVTKAGWVMCPFCRKKKLLHVGVRTVIRDLPWTCGRCGKTVNVNIDPPEPAAKEPSA